MMQSEFATRVNIRPRPELVNRLNSYTGSHDCRILFKQAAETIMSPYIELDWHVLRRKLQGIDKRHDRRAKQLAEDTINFMELRK